MKKKLMYRVYWEHEITRLQGHGEWFESRELVQTWVIRMNGENNGCLHYVESNTDN